jgi:hypothetical protein
MEKLCQLMMAFGELVICSRLPAWWMAAVPRTTFAPVGLASTVDVAKQEPTATAVSVRPNGRARLFLTVIPLTL